MLNRTQRTLYRLLMRYTSRMKSSGIERIDIQPMIDPNAWLSNGGAHAWVRPPPECHVSALRSFLPWLDERIIGSSGSYTANELKDIIRESFRKGSMEEKRDTSGGNEGKYGLKEDSRALSDATFGRPNIAEMVDRGFQALRVLTEQLHLARCSSTAETNGVRVDVSSGFVGTSEELDPGYDESYQPKNYFTYHVRISNMGDEVVQLVSRHWIIKDAIGNVVAEVAKGSRGVVGCTPILKRGQSFSYYSGTDLEEKDSAATNRGQENSKKKRTKEKSEDKYSVSRGKSDFMLEKFKYCGSMEGSFEMVVLNARGQPTQRFDADIATFEMWRPKKSHEE